jgi:tetratricopeptide (TPR) repeat protein
MARRSWRALLVLLPLLAFPLLADEPEIRPLSEVERVAVEDMAQYLSRGPQAVYDELAAASPLRKLSQHDALEEIEVRLGPPNGATWELQTVSPVIAEKTAVFNVSYPSGLDETVMLDLVPENGGYRITMPRILAEVSPNPPIFPAEPESVSQEEKPSNGAGMALALGLGTILLSVGAAFLRGSNRPLAVAMTITAIAAVATGIAIAVVRDDRFTFHRPAVEASVVPHEKPDVLRLATLLPLRRAMIAGDGSVAAAFKKVAIGGVYRDIASLWKAQADLQQLHSVDVATTLRHFPTPSDIPLVEVLRARLAFSEAKEVDTVVAYERAISLGPARDALWLEAAQALTTLGFTERTEDFLKRLHRLGSRNADVYYETALLHATKNREEAAEAALRTAWNLRPAERADIIRSGAFWATLRKGSDKNVVSLSDAAEATFAAPDVTKRAISLPTDAMPRVSGNYLHITVGQQELAVPGGAALAPVGTPVVDAGLWHRTEEQRSLADLEQLVASARSPGAFTQPMLGKRVERCADALANHNRWADLVRLTDGLSPKAENIPTDLFFLRDTALQRMNRMIEAKQLLADLAVSRTLQRKNDPAVQERLGEMLASVDLWDASIKLLAKAGQQRRGAMIDDRIRQIQMNKRLATKYATFSSPHFEIHYPDEASQNFAKESARILEAELTRLQKWVPTPNFQPVVVNMLWWDEFRSTYTGNDFILGFYQGKITLPLVGVRSFSPPIVALMSHELCHAMIAQATNDQAPHWFHEGLAQRIEMVPYHANAFNMYDDDRLLSISLIDDIITGSPDPDMIGEGYIESQTIIRFIEATYGQAGVGKVLAAFREGATTDEAILKLSGVDVAQFDTKLRAWGRAEQKVFENTDIISYETSGDDALVRRDL